MILLVFDGPHGKTMVLLTDEGISENLPGQLLEIDWLHLQQETQTRKGLKSPFLRLSSV